MTTQKNQTRSGDDARVETAESSAESDTGASESDQSHGSRRTFLEGVGLVGTISLAGCTEVTINENGITWGEDDGATATPDSGATDTPDSETLDDESTEEDDEIDLSEYEDGCFSGGTPKAAEGVRDGVEITVTPAGIEEQIQLVREIRQVELNEDIYFENPFEDEEEDEVIEVEYVFVPTEDEEDDDE